MMHLGVLRTFQMACHAHQVIIIWRSQLKTGWMLALRRMTALRVTCKWKFLIKMIHMCQSFKISIALCIFSCGYLNGLLIVANLYSRAGAPLCEFSGNCLPWVFFFHFMGLILTRFHSWVITLGFPYFVDEPTLWATEMEPYLALQIELISFSCCSSAELNWALSFSLLSRTMFWRSEFAQSQNTVFQSAFNTWWWFTFATEFAGIII